MHGLCAHYVHIMCSIIHDYDQYAIYVRIMLIYVLINKLCAYYVTLVPLCPHYTSQLCTIMCIMCMQMYMGNMPKSCTIMLNYAQIMPHIMHHYA